MKEILLKVPRFKQKKMTCGHSSIQQVMVYYGIKKTLTEILKEIKLRKTGVWESHIGVYALQNGFKATIYTCDINIFDMSWKKLDNKQMIKKLEQRLKQEKRPEYVWGINGHIDYLKNNGKIKLEIINKHQIINALSNKLPVIANLSSTVLYSIRRKYKGKNDDVRGAAAGHFVVISGYRNDKFHIVDPLSKKVKSGKYWANADDIVGNINLWPGSLLIVRK